MAVLIGYTGFVGSHLRRCQEFELLVNSTNKDDLRGCSTDLLVCAGLPAAKWIANQSSEADWINMTGLADALSSTTTERAILISTIDVYQPPVGVNESRSPSLDGEEAYGRNRAWFENFFRSRYPNALIIRLPGLLAPDLRKNFVFDLLNNQEDQFMRVNAASTFQFFDVRDTWRLALSAEKAGIELLNVATEPVRAQDVASLFGVKLSTVPREVHYDVHSIYATTLRQRMTYLFDAQETIAKVADLRRYHGLSS